MRNWIKSHPEIKGILLALFVISQYLSLFTFSASQAKANALGLVGFSIAWFWYFFFGISSFFILLALGYHAYRLIYKSLAFDGRSYFFSLFLAGSALSLLVTIGTHFVPSAEVQFNKLLGFSDMQLRLGGMPFYGIFHRLPYLNLENLFNFVGTALFSLTVAFLSLVYFLEIPLKDLLIRIKDRFSAKKKKAPIVINGHAEDITPKRLKARSQPITRSIEQLDHFLDVERDFPINPEVTNSAKKKVTKAKEVKPVLLAEPEQQSLGNFSMPSLDLLQTPKKVDSSPIVKELKTKADLLEETLLSFGIEAKVGQIHCGPTITSFEVHPAVGVKIGKIKTLEHDIALNLEAKSIRIIAPIPGKPAVGIEVPNKHPQEVSFKELLVGYQNLESPHKIPMLLGKAVSGDLIIADLAKMPHCIIAGATGSGKSVCINAIVMSIVMTARPDQIKMLMIDPKKVELTPYTNLPHMLAPVITEPSNACAALQWLVKEMEKRYEILKLTGQRNIDSFNKRTIDEHLEKTFHIPIPEKLPYYVGIIDELADLMMVASQDIETPIARIAQMARAVGIHLILATQRPSREVITGLIRANFPARIAFKVASRINSQIILDDTGAENLLGNGDMLFLLPGSPQLIRAQGAFVRDDEINKVITHLCNQAPPQYLIKSFDEIHVSTNRGAGQDSVDDTLYGDAKQIVVSTGNASTTFLQRKLKIGYARAASLMDALEMQGIVSAQDGSKPRKVLYPQGDTDEAEDFFD